jgi:hypothetical protein
LGWLSQIDQLTLNQRVQGSSPCAPTSNINELSDFECAIPKISE